MRILLSLLLAAVACTSVAQSLTPVQREALNAAEKWLVPVDSRRYNDAWAMAAESFKSKVARDEFRSGIARIRNDYGKLVKRSGEKMAFRGDAPAADQGDAPSKVGTEVAILFESTFAGNRQAQEEINVVLEKDGIWRVAGYYIR